jgi:hypothetical protein
MQPVSGGADELAESALYRTSTEAALAVAHRGLFRHGRAGILACDARLPVDADSRCLGFVM